MDREVLEKLAELESKANNETWIIHEHGIAWSGNPNNTEPKPLTERFVHYDDAVFIAELRNHARELIQAAADCERMREALEQIKAMQETCARQSHSCSCDNACLDIATAALAPAKETTSPGRKAAP